MSTATSTALLTADDVLRMPELADVKYELVAGELRVMEPARGAHGLVEINLLGALIPYVRAHGLGALFTPDTGFRLKRDPDTVRAPDVAFVRAGRLAPEGLDNDAGFVELAPDLAVEVTSARDTVASLGEKIAEYLEVGVHLVWVVDPANRMVTVYAADRSARLLTEADALDGSDVLPGFHCPVADLFTGVRRKK